jgi:hypothetical protein
MLSNLSLVMSHVFIQDKVKVLPPKDLLSDYDDDENLKASTHVVGDITM